MRYITHITLSVSLNLSIFFLPVVQENVNGLDLGFSKSITWSLWRRIFFFFFLTAKYRITFLQRKKMQSIGDFRNIVWQCITAEMHFYAHSCLFN